MKFDSLYICCIAAALAVNLASAASASRIAKAVGNLPIIAGKIAKPTGTVYPEFTSTVPHWLTLPESRIVVNPFFGNYSDRTDLPTDLLAGALPVNVAYYVGSGPERLEGLWSIDSLDSSGALSRTALGPVVDLTPNASWTAGGATVVRNTNSVSVSAINRFGSISQSVTVDLDKTPFLFVHTLGRHAFDMKVNDASANVDTLLRPVRCGSGVAGDIRAATGWHGTKHFSVILFALGTSQPITFDRVQLVGLIPQAEPRATQHWAPHIIESRLVDHSGANLVESEVTFLDVNGVIQRLKFAHGTHSAVIAGRFTGDATWDSRRSVLHLGSAKYRVGIRFSRPVRWLGTRSDEIDWSNSSIVHSGTEEKVWKIAIDKIRPRDTVEISAVFTPIGITSADWGFADGSQRQSASFRSASIRNEALWKRLLAQVPRPINFHISDVDPKSVTDSDVRSSYYAAWAYLLGNTLPPMPENGYPYPQICTGKASLWTDGAPKSPETAVWDGAIAMQALAMTHSELCWNTLEGMFSQVDPNGYMPGELLPTVYGQTTWTVFQQHPDRNRLKRVYPALRRYIDWRVAHPHWVYPNKSIQDVRPSSAKSNEFVVHEIIDMGYARKISDELHLPNEGRHWKDLIAQSLNDYYHWFWPTPEVVFNDYYSELDRSGADIDWTLKGLGMGRELLARAERDHLLQLFQAHFDSGRPFGIEQTRFSDLEPITLGLFANGDVSGANALSETAMRDVTRAGDYSETYTKSEPPKPDGVRPSAFGARLMIDSVLWHNGVIIDEGLPVLIGMPAAAGVKHILVRGFPLDVRFTKGSSELTLSGTALQILNKPSGFKVHEDGRFNEWIGPIGAGETLLLSAHP